MTLKTDTPASQDASVTDRRRPGRIENVNPALIPLLRSGEPASAELDNDATYGDPDQLAGMRGLFFGVAISAPLWFGIACLGRWILS